MQLPPLPLLLASWLSSEAVSSQAALLREAMYTLAPWATRPVAICQW